MNFKTVSGNLDFPGLAPEELIIDANDVIYKGTPISVSGAGDIAAAEITIILNGRFTLTGSAADVASGIYTNQTGTMTLVSSISVTDATSGAINSETSFLPTNEITLNFDGTLDFNDDNLTITDTSKVTVNYDSDGVGGNDTELKINSLGNNVYDTSKSIDR